MTALVDWLGEMVAINAAQKLQTVQVQIEGRPLVALPTPVADLILQVGSVKEAVLVEKTRNDPEA